MGSFPLGSAGLWVSGVFGTSLQGMKTYVHCLAYFTPKQSTHLDGLLVALVLAESADTAVSVCMNRVSSCWIRFSAAVKACLALSSCSCSMRFSVVKYCIRACSDSKLRRAGFGEQELRNIHNTHKRVSTSIRTGIT